MENVLVTGGAGYVGSHVCKALYQNGYRPFVFDNLRYGHEWAVQWGELIKGDLADTDLLTSVFQRVAPVAVLHFAACTYVGESWEDPLSYYQNNVGCTLSLLAAMQSAKVPHLVFSSTCAVYGEPEIPFIHENLPLKPISPYGRSKEMVEKILADVATTNRLRYVALRYFNAAGADAAGDIGEDHDPETHLIPLAIDAGFGGMPLKIMGTDYPTPDGTAIRDYTHVTDLASAHVKALHYLRNGGESTCINLGSGKGYSVKQIVTALQEMGVPVQASPAPRRAGDPPRLEADITRAKTLLNWQPEHSGLENILKTAVNWQRRQR